MIEASSGKDGGWRAVLERFEQHAPASVMARTVLDRAFPPDWIDDVLERHRRSQWARELLFSTSAYVPRCTALVQASAGRLASAMAGLGSAAILPGWPVHVLDGNHFPGTEKRVARLRGQRGAAEPSRGGS